MATDCITEVTFQGEAFAKPVVARCDQADASTDGGLLLVKALDAHVGLTARLAACLDDARQPGKVLHETIELLQQRIFGVCGGYEVVKKSVASPGSAPRHCAHERHPLSTAGCDRAAGR